MEKTGCAIKYGKTLKIKILLMKNTMLFVYYKIPTAQRHGFLTSVQQLTDQVTQFDQQLTVEILQRPELGSDGNETWMEVYRHPEGISSQMIEKIQEIASTTGLPLQRKNEIFIPLRGDQV
jgi:hypothetical protein